MSMRILGLSADSCAVINAIDKQSPDIAQGVDEAYEIADGCVGWMDERWMWRGRGIRG